jgi:hypothetical protein
MKPNEIAERPRFPAGDRRLAAVDAPLGFERPFLRILAAKRRNVLLTYLPFRRTWTRHDPDLSRVKVATACALHVH